MKRYRSAAVVLRAGALRESDRLLVLFMRDHGKIRAVAKGARRSRRRGLGALQIFSHLRVEIVESPRSAIPRLESATLLHAFYGFAADPVLLGYGSYLLELVDGFSPELVAFPDVFDLLVAFLHRLDRGDRPERLLRVFELLAADGFGFRPNLETCIGCGTELGEEPGMGFDPFRGGGVCPRCAKGARSAAMGPATLRAMRRLLAVERRALDGIEVPRAALTEMRGFLPAFVEHHLERPPRSVRYLRAFRTAGGAVPSPSPRG